MQTTTTTLASLIDGALYELEAPSERGRPLVLSSNFLENTTLNIPIWSDGAVWKNAAGTTV